MEELNDKLIEINDTLKKWRKLNDSYVAPLSRIMSSLNESTYTYSGTWGDLQKCTKMKNKLSEKINKGVYEQYLLLQRHIESMKKEEETIANQIQEFMVLYINGDDDTFPSDALISIEYIFKVLDQLKKEISKETQLKDEIYQHLFFTNYNQQLLYVTTANYSPYISQSTLSDFEQILNYFDTL